MRKSSIQILGRGYTVFGRSTLQCAQELSRDTRFNRPAVSLLDSHDPGITVLGPDSGKVNGRGPGYQARRRPQECGRCVTRDMCKKRGKKRAESDAKIQANVIALDELSIVSWCVWSGCLVYAPKTADRSCPRQPAWQLRERPERRPDGQQ